MSGAARAGEPGMRILVVSVCFPPSWRWAGTTRSIWNLCRGLAAAGAKVGVVTTDSDLERPLRVPRERVEQGIPVAARRVPTWGGRPASRYGLAPAIVPAVWRASRDARLCVIQGVWTFPLAVASRICRWRRVPYVVCARGTLEELSLSEKAAKKRLYLRLVERGSLARAAAVQFDTELELERSRAALGATPAIVSPSALEFEERVEPAGDRLRRRLGLDADSLLLGMSGRIHPRKGFDVIVPALARCDGRFHLVSFGSHEGDYAERVAGLAREHGVADRVHFLGQLDGRELCEAYASIDLLVLPSRGESFGNVVIEALAQGTEVLVSAGVPLQGYVRRHGLGEVVREPEPAAWAAAIEGWSGRRGAFDGARASARVRRDFDYRTIGERLLAAYAGLLDAAG